MASIEFITKRIEGKEKEVAKLTKKIERIRRAQDSNWEDNPYYYDELDLKYAERDLTRANDALAKYRADLEVMNHKAHSRNIPAIIQFLDNWKKLVTEYFVGSFYEYPDAVDQLEKDMKAYHLDWFEERKLKKEDPVKYREYIDGKTSLKAEFAARFGHILPYVERVQNPDTLDFEWAFNSEKLAKDLDEEANRKYDFIIERTSAIVEEITDASHLEIGEKGDLNGFIIGTKGTAKVRTIGAGGYNIQCFHFRTLVTKMK